MATARDEGNPTSKKKPRAAARVAAREEAAGQKKKGGPPRTLAAEDIQVVNLQLRIAGGRVIGVGGVSVGRDPADSDQFSPGHGDAFDGGATDDDRGDPADPD